MPLDVLGSRRATPMYSTKSIALADRPGNLQKFHHDGDRSLQLLVFNEEFLVSEVISSLTTPPCPLYTPPAALPIEWSGEVNPRKDHCRFHETKRHPSLTKLHTMPRWATGAGRVRNACRIPRQASRSGADGFQRQRPRRSGTLTHEQPLGATALLKEEAPGRSHAAWPLSPDQHVAPEATRSRVHLPQGHADAASPHPAFCCPPPLAVAGGSPGGEADWSPLPPGRGWLKNTLPQGHFARRSGGSPLPGPGGARVAVRGPAQEDPCRAACPPRDRGLARIAPQVRVGTPAEFKHINKLEEKKLTRIPLVTGEANREEPKMRIERLSPLNCSSAEAALHGRTGRKSHGMGPERVTAPCVPDPRDRCEALSAKSGCLGMQPK
ncbi:hypothetical protein H6P81_021336 [Aristolochia fimbriata]|uniref:Uncharacterized protein n=1 Tax=Aristolochia fimbriata TaxID=158543 RepID=A0AAV7DRA2_ARIFI|nr:hypothetical protein H6P81_021336 [Aristolochia fimbriata]